MTVESDANMTADSDATKHGADERSWALVLAVASLAIGAIAALELPDPAPLDIVVALPALAFLLRALVPAFPVWAVFLAALMPSFGVNVSDLRAEGVLFLLILALCYVSFYEDRRWITYACAASALLAPRLILELTGSDSWGWQFWTLGALFGAGFGEVAHRYRLQLDELRRTKALVADQALLEERRRIARDVHDLVGHSLAVVMLQVTAARELVRCDPDEAEAALDDAARVGRESLGEIRHTLGLLRDGERDATVPSPLLTDVHRLVAEYSAAGLHVDCAISGDLSGLERSRSIAGYRIVQEALANAGKHAVAGTTCLGIVVTTDMLSISVRSPMAGGARRSTGGYGLVGMRERASSVGGTLRAGPDGGQWVVEATLPRIGASV